MAWTAVTDAMLSAGRLLTPEISYNMMERDWAAFTVPVDWQHTNTFWQDTDSPLTWDVTCVFPESWALDTTLDSDARLKLVLYLEFRKAGGAGAVNMGFTTNSLTTTGDVSDTSFAWYKLERYWDGTLPTGATDVEITMGFTAGTTSSRVRRLEGSGPDSYYWLDFT